MPQSKKKDAVAKQREEQQELIELKRKKQEFESNIEAYEAPKPSEVAVKQGFMSKISNFWFYWRFKLLAFLIIAAILTVGVHQCATRTKYDMTIVVYFKTYLSSNMIENIAKIAENYAEDTNGDGEVNVLVMDCAIPDEERELETGRAKSTRLMAQFQNKEAIVYMVDDEALAELDTLANGVFVDNSLELPGNEGKSYQLNGSVFDAAFDTIELGYSKNFNYHLVRRIVDGTQLEKKKDVAKYSEQGNRFIKAVMADPNLKNEK